MPQKKAEDEDLTFLVTTNPFATSAADKRRVRSAAALKSWPERRKKVSRKLRDSEEGEETSDFIEQGPSSPRSSIRISSLDPRPSNTSEDVPFYYEVRHPGTATSITHSIQINSPPTVAEPCPRQKTPELPCKCWRCDAQRHQSLVRQKRPRVDLQSRKRLADGSLKFSGGLALITPPSSPEPEQPVSSRADPFNCYPVPYHPWFDGILHHMLTIYAPRGWPALKITREQGIKWEWFMTQHALAEPALFYVRLLFGSGDLIRLKVLKPEITYWLRAQAIKAINQALEDPARAISDPMILAVGRIALHESMYGDRHAANMIHRPAQRRMIQMRGGMNALDFPDLVKRLMRWADTVMSKQGNTERFLEDEEKEPNFTMSQSVNVLEQWVPSEGQELRRKIKISDLVNDLHDDMT